MKYIKEKMPMNINLYNKLNNICIFNNINLEVINGVIFKIENTNISFIEPHRFIVIIDNIKIILLCYDNLNLCLYDKDKPINIPILRDIIVNIKKEVK